MGASVPEQALPPSAPEPVAGLSPSGDDPSRDAVIAGFVETIKPEMMKAVAKFTDAAYCSILDSVQDYLTDNTQYNLGADIAALRHENQDLRGKLAGINRALGTDWKDDPHAIIARLLVHEARYYSLIYSVANRFEGEERHETALRYIREREDSQGPSTASAIEARRAETGTGSVHESAVAQPDAQSPLA